MVAAAAPNYEPIPDAEQPDEFELPSSDILIAKAQAKYPEAGTKVEAEFLGRLDDAIDNAQPKIEIPRISPDQLRPSSEIKDSKALLKALKLPTIALISLTTVALLLMVTDSPLAKMVYPYVTCVVMFMSSVPDIRKRFLGAVKPVLKTIETMKPMIESKVEGISAKGLKYLTVTESSMKKAIAPIKEKLVFATKLESALRQIPQSIFQVRQGLLSPVVVAVELCAP
jgi:hypothetical protein